MKPHLQASGHFGATLSPVKTDDNPEESTSTAMVGGSGAEESQIGVFEFAERSSHDISPD